MLLLQPAPLLSPSYMLHQVYHHAAMAVHIMLEGSASSFQAILFLDGQHSLPLLLLYSGVLNRAASGVWACRSRCRPGHDHVTGHLSAGFAQALALTCCMPFGPFSQRRPRTHCIHSTDRNIKLFATSPLYGSTMPSGMTTQPTVICSLGWTDDQS